MKAISKILAGGIGLAALAGAAPAAAQYYPNPYPQNPYGYGYGNQGGLGAIIDQILGQNRYYNGADQRFLVQQCIAAVTNRVARNYNTPYGSPYGGYGTPYGGYGNSQSARVLGITDIDRRSSTLRVRGTATANAFAAAPYGSPYGSPYGGQYGSPYGNQYGYGYGQPQQVGELTFRCDVDYRGRVRDIDIDRNRNAYRYYRR